MSDQNSAGQDIPNLVFNIGKARAILDVIITNAVNCLRVLSDPSAGIESEIVFPDEFSGLKEAKRDFDWALLRLSIAFDIEGVEAAALQYAL